MNIKPRKIDQEMERAITMVVHCVNKKCRNPKPLILHSIRVGLKLCELKQAKEVVIAGILHDLVEDTNCTLKVIENEFGKTVARLVASFTQEKVDDYKERWCILMNKIIKAGKAAMLVKLVDIYENLDYIPSIRKKDRKTLIAVYWKHNFGMNCLKPYLGHLKIFRDCRNDYRKVFKKMGIK